MYRIFLNSFIGVVVITGVFLGFFQDTYAQEKPCTVDSATITAKTPGVLKNGIYPDLYSEGGRTNNPVTITVTTKDCVGKEVFVSLSGSDNPAWAEVVLNKAPFKVPAGNSFTITMIPGQYGCTKAIGADCTFRVNVFTSKTDTNFYTSRNKPKGNLDYECEGLCDNGSRWGYVSDTSDNEQKQESTCIIKNALFDPWADVPATTYRESQPYNVTITVNTLGCAGDDLVLTLKNDAAVLTSVDVLNKKTFTVAEDSEQLIIKLTAGEEGCSNKRPKEDGGECDYFLESEKSAEGQKFSSKKQADFPKQGMLRYMCDGNCSNVGANWQLREIQGEEQAPAVPLEDGGFSTGIDPNSACFDSATGKMIPGCYSLFSGFADALGNKITKISNIDGLGGLFNAIIAFAIGAAGVIAVGRIVYLGFRYMGFKKEGKPVELDEVKTELWTVVIGLLLLLSTYTILRTINPDLLNLMPRIDSAAFKTGGDTPSPVPLAVKADLRKNAAAYGITCPGTGGKEALAGIAQSFVGKVTYSYGAKGTVGPNNTISLDCSGFVDAVYSCAGLPSPGAGTYNIFKDATPITAASKTQINNQNLSVGDLIGWTQGSITNGKREIAGHVVMYIGNGKTIEATSNNQGKQPGKGVQIRDADAYKLARLKFWKKI